MTLSCHSENPSLLLFCLRFLLPAPHPHRDSYLRVCVCVLPVSVFHWLLRECLALVLHSLHCIHQGWVLYLLYKTALITSRMASSYLSVHFLYLTI